MGGGADGGEIVEERAALLPAAPASGYPGGGEHAGDELIAGGGLRAQALFAPEDGRADGAFGGVVGGFDAGDRHEPQERRPEGEQGAAEAGRFGGGAVLPGPLQHPELGLDEQYAGGQARPGGGVVEALGAAFVVAGNGIVAAPGAVVLGPLSVAGAAVAINVGTVALSYGVDRAREG